MKTMKALSIRQPWAWLIVHGVWMSQETEGNLRFDPTHWMPLPAPPTT